MFSAVACLLPRSSSAWLALFVVLVNASDVAAQPRAKVLPAAAPVVMTVETQPGTDVFRASPDHELALLEHPPIETIPPIPMPTRVARKLVPRASAPVSLSRDVETGEVRRHAPIEAPLLPGVNKVDGYDGADGGGRAVEPRMTGGMTVVSNPELSPWRMNCKLVTRFQNTSGESIYSSGSCALIDAETVITAGHCVYSHDYGWAREGWVYPAWDGIGNIPNAEIVNYYGFGRATEFYCNSGWINDRDYDYDLGVIEITRSVGTLTGWFGYSGGGDCSYHLGFGHHNASYPGDSCHTGRTMYYWYGDFDDCDGNMLVLDTTPGCLTETHKGMSGSGAYFIQNNNRYVSSVCSSKVPGHAYYPRIWDQLFGWIKNDYIPTARGTAFDLQALEMRGTQSTVQAGSTLSGLSHLATNPTNGSATKTFSMGVYLSDNNNISTADTLLSTQTVGATINAMSSLRLTMQPVAIPGDTPPGTYYVGVVYDSTTDSNTTNNATHTWDAFRITVTAAPPPSPPVINSSLAATGKVGTAFNYAITATNSPTSYNATNLPAGLTVNTSNGVISGVPTTSGTRSVTLSAVNAGGTGYATLSLTISTNAPPPPVINSAQFLSGAVGTGVEYYITATNSPTSYNASNLPPGLTVNTATGRIAGTPTTAGLWDSTISATNAGGTGTAVLTFSFYSLPTNPPVINSPLSAETMVGNYYSYWITAANSPTSYNATNLPAGLTVNTANGEISGTPTMAGLWHVTISAYNNDGSDSEVLTFTVNDSPPPPPCDCVLDCLLQANVNAGKQAVEKLLPLIEIPFPLRSLLTSMRGVRDNVLKATPEGRRLVDAYYGHSNDVWRILINRPELIVETVQLVTELEAALVASEESGIAKITPLQWSRGERLLSRLQAAATPELRAELDFLHQFLQERKAIQEGQVLVQLRPADVSVVKLSPRSSAPSLLMLCGFSTFILAVAWPIRRKI